MNEISNKILIINELPLPNELIDIIKNYVFYNIIEETKKRKNKIISLFNSNNIYYSKDQILKLLIMYDLYYRYPIIGIIGISDTLYNINKKKYNKNKKKEDIKWYFFLTYCKTCGKYVRREQHLITYTNKNLHCGC